MERLCIFRIILFSKIERVFENIYSQTTYITLLLLLESNLKISFTILYLLYSQQQNVKSKK
jgi:hypothetical protein